MDIVLEVFDTYILDRCYAALIPESSRTIIHDAIHAANSSTYIFDTFVGPSPIDWVYKPSTKYFSIQPTEYAYLSLLPRDNILRQFFSLFLITLVFGAVLYSILSTASYYLVFDKKTLQHPLYIKNQVRLEIAQALSAMPLMAFLTAPFFTAEVRGYSKMFDTIDDGPGFWYFLLQIPLFLFFTDCGVYLIHRGLHHPLVYKTIHKPHHKWIVPTPFASHAFHPLDGYSQSIPYHVFPFIFPLQKWVYVMLFIFVNVWTVMIHDGEYVANNPAINGAASHTIHHLYFNYNYGQYFTLWDRLCGSYRKPNAELFNRKARTSNEELARQRKEFSAKVAEVEGVDDRVYLPSSDGSADEKSSSEVSGMRKRQVTAKQ